MKSAFFSSLLNRPVIIKRLQQGIEQRRLLDEQKALAKLRSKHFVQLYDVVQLSDRRQPETAIVLEYIDGANLEIGSYKPNRKYIHTLWQIACGLRDIHEAGVIHRDIKPNNIRLDKEGVIKIIDFGLARSSDAAKTRSIIGTPVFMAPELWGGKTISFDASIDAYAFGATALALLSTDAPTELAQQPPQPISLPALSVGLPGLSAPTISLVHRCLAHSPANRPSMAEVQFVLQQQLLENQHRALVVFGGTTHHLDRKNRKINVNAGPVGSIGIEYNGTEFVVISATGAVFLNNTPARVGHVVPGCCVITFGNAGQARRFVTFDVSMPEVMP
ncbi:serine/threonine protein kinase (plasmid) [Xanthobacter dioxanivorans]|uniref:Serine/threonine protein kinase n=1 Tax=Xanthobacter dioxanivorans TaxID=2528964 RepID=A0A974SMP0_9HYPH|nr:serine/threonine-protein kinase [Xanthobacter dioxanivorans]QRG09983.1 serine/threonine protein kinase [Xanthobacter dioxanivorans]